MTTKLLLHCNSGLPLVEETGRVVSANNNTNGIGYYSSPVLFVGGCAYCGGYTENFSVPASSDFAFGTGDFKLRMFVRLSSTAGKGGTLISNLSGSTGFKWSIPEGSSMVLQIGPNSYSTSISLATMATYFFDVTRISGVLRFAINGAQTGSDITCVDDVTVSTEPLRIGGTSAWLGSIHGYFDELQITAGVVSASQAVPTIEFAYPDSFPITITVNGFSSTQFGAPSIQKRMQDIFLTGFQATNFGTPEFSQFFTPLPQTIYHVNEGPTTRFGTPSISRGMLVESLGGVTKFGLPTVTVAGKTIEPTGFCGTNFGQPAISRQAEIKATGFNTTNFGTPRLAVNQTISLQGFKVTNFGFPSLPGYANEFPEGAVHCRTGSASVFIRKEA